MKEVKTFIVVDFLLFLIKLIAGLVCNSYTIMASGIYDLILIITALFLISKKDNKSYKGIISSLWGFIVVLSGLGIIFFSMINKIEKVSFFILLFLLLTIIIRYFGSCFYTNISYQKKKGLLSYGNINSSIDFYNYGVIIGVLIFSKLSRWLDIFKYADRLGTILIAILIIIRGIKIIVNSFKYLENKNNLVNKEEIRSEILKRDEIKDLEKIEVYSFGGITKLNCMICIRDSLQLLDLNSFIVTLQDYLLKFANVVQINLVEKHEKKKVKVRSMKQDARNSRSRNSKTNSKKKNSKQKNKKR